MEVIESVVHHHDELNILVEIIQYIVLLHQVFHLLLQYLLNKITTWTNTDIQKNEKTNADRCLNEKKVVLVAYSKPYVYSKKPRK